MEEQWAEIKDFEEIIKYLHLEELNLLNKIKLKVK